MPLFHLDREAAEDRTTQRELEAIYNWIKDGTNEGISFEIAHLTDDAFTDSFIGDGDCSLFTPSGARGTLNSQGSNGNVLDSGGGVPHSFPFTLTINLNTGNVNGSWTYPGGGPAQTPTFKLVFYKRFTGDGGENLIFYADQSSDNAGYIITFTLL
jgi:hypothetical protein